MAVWIRDDSEQKCREIRLGWWLGFPFRQFIKYGQCFYMIGKYRKIVGYKWEVIFGSSEEVPKGSDPVKPYNFKTEWEGLFFRGPARPIFACRVLVPDELGARMFLNEGFIQRGFVEGDCFYEVEYVGKE